MPATDRPRFAEALRLGPILLDGPMGSRLIDRGLDLRLGDPALWVLDHPEIVLEIHRRDIHAGSDAILTNTFGANRVWLGRFSRETETPAINRRAVEIARLAAGPGRYVIGSIGPTASSNPAALREQADALLDAGADALILETHRGDQAEAALRLLGPTRGTILASLFDWPESVADQARRLIGLGASAVGSNCRLGMADALRLAAQLHEVGDHPWLMKPSAGLPGGPTASPESFQQAVAGLLKMGVRLVGGCCGATEAHVSGLRAGLDATRGDWDRPGR